jgi:hypothetical protein
MMSGPSILDRSKGTNMRNQILWSVWLLFPVGFAAWHFGPGQQWLHRDQAAEILGQARAAAQAGEMQTAAVSYANALQQWPEDSVAARRKIRLAEAKATIESGELVVGQEQLMALITEMQGDKNADADILWSARHELATSAYYAAWIMRLEGAEADEWMQEAETARQQFRLLAESNGDVDEQRIAAENLEATIVLEQMDLRTLMARPLPKNCCSKCSSLCQQKRKQQASRCQNEGKTPQEEEPKDARKEIKQMKGAGLYDGNSVGS